VIHDDASLHDVAERALALMRAQGFDEAQVDASSKRHDEVNFAHDEPSLLRSTETQKVALLGIVDGRKASTELTEVDDASLRERVASLAADAGSAPRDDANAVSSAQRSRIVQGPQEGDLALLADTVRELLEFRARETPQFRLEEGYAAHTLLRSCTLTSRGSDLACSAGWYSINAFGTARDGQAASSFNHAGGATHELADHAVQDLFGIGAMLRDTVRQIHTQPIGEKFVGEVVLTPGAVEDLLGWLHGQIGDLQLIAGSSLYRDKVGSAIASPLLTLKSRFDAPGVVAQSADAFVAQPLDVLRAGVLVTLTPSLYGSRKTGLPHVPVASGGGWELSAGTTPRADVIAGVARGALVGRLSMGRPAANGDFSAVIKNSFAIRDGVPGAALAETMISGNVAHMLRDVSAVSRERLDTGATLLPWLRIGGLHFS
jgi:PmbA protein